MRARLRPGPLGWSIFLTISAPGASAGAQTAVVRARDALQSLGPTACAEAAAPTWSLRLGVVVYPDGQWSLAVGPFLRAAPPLPAEVHRVYDCAYALLSARLAPVLPRPPRAVQTVAVTLRYADPPAPPQRPVERVAPREPRPDGTEGAICGWGQRRADYATLPTPTPCRAGLTCCSAGGAAGSDAVCMRVAAGDCPRYP